MFERATEARSNPTKEIFMASDERYEDVPKKLDDTVSEGEAKQVYDAPTGFPDRWSGGPDDSAKSGAEFGESWSGNPGTATVKGEEFGERWSGGPDSSPERAEKFGEAWSGENADTTDDPEKPES
jgi:hypothetical protein